MRWNFIRITTITVLIALIVTGPVMGQGGVITAGGISQGAISDQIPLVLYSFQGTAGDDVLIQVISLSTAFNPSVSLLSPTQQSLASSDSDLLNPASQDARLEYRLPQTGVYSLLVGSGDGSRGEFILRLFVQQPAASDVSLPAVPGEVSVPVSILPQTLSLDATNGQPLVLSVISQNENFNYLVEIRDSDNRLIALLNGLGEVSLFLPPGDTYTVTLSALTSDTTGELTVSARLVDITPAVTPEVASTVLPQDDDTCRLTPAGNNAINVRSGPGTNYNTITTLQAGQQVNVVGKQGDWYAVEIDGVIGWVFSEVVSTSGNCDNLGSPEAATPTQTTTVSDTPPANVTASATPTATNTPPAGQPTPTDTQPAQPPTATTAQNVQQPTPSYTPTATVNATSVFTATYTPTNTAAATQNILPNLTPTNTVTATPTPTATYTYTPTVPAPEAPEDARFNSPLTIPLDTTASVTDFVSYPGGDREDRVRYDVTGMNPNTALSGGRARLILAVSCFGTGTQNVQFFTGGQTYSCGQTIADREITYDSRTGQVTITAIAGEGTYVQWVLTGTATRVN